MYDVLNTTFCNCTEIIHNIKEYGCWYYRYVAINCSHHHPHHPPIKVSSLGCYEVQIPFMFLSNGVVGKFVLGFVTLSVYVGIHGSDHLVHACKLLYMKKGVF